MYTHNVGTNFQNIVSLRVDNILLDLRPICTNSRVLFMVATPCRVSCGWCLVRGARVKSDDDHGSLQICSARETWEFHFCACIQDVQDNNRQTLKARARETKAVNDRFGWAVDTLSSETFSLMRDEHDRNSIPAMHQPKSLSDNASKINVSTWGSTGTMSTSSQASSSILAKNAYENPHCVHLDLTSIDNSDSSEEITLFGHARVASYSDISSDGSGYYDRLAQHCQRSREARCSIETSLLTLNNLKLLCSCALWFVSYMIMGVFGGSVAYLHFARSDKDVPDPLPDFGYDVIPVSRSIHHRVLHSFCLCNAHCIANFFFMEVLVSTAPTCAPWKCPKHRFINSLFIHIARRGSPLEPPSSHAIECHHMQWWRSSYSSASVSSELSSLSNTDNHSWIDRAAATKSKMREPTASTSDIHQCTKVCYGTRFSSSFMWWPHIQWACWLHAHLHGCVAQAWLFKEPISCGLCLVGGSDWDLLHN